jgi:5-deoxy-glucuronate isomerase
MDLLRKTLGQRGLVHDITPQSAGWGYVGFQLHRLQAGDLAQGSTGKTEAILVMVEGNAQLNGAGQDWGQIGARMDVFEKTPPHCIYFPAGSAWQARADTDCTIAICAAPANAA